MTTAQARTGWQRILVTRPQPEADRWTALLHSHGLPAQALPLINIGPATAAAERAAADQARAQWQQYDAIMLVSGNAAQYFFDKNMLLALGQSAQAAIKTRVWTPGPGTAKAVRALGIGAAYIDQPSADAGQFDSESLWQRVGPQMGPGSKVLIVRGSSLVGDDEVAYASATPVQAHTGGNGREWLRAQLQAAGAAVDVVAVYERRAPDWNAETLAQARAALQGNCCWLFSSSEAVMHLRNIFSTPELATAQALTTHPRIAQAAVEAGFAAVKQCRPTVADVVASLESPI